LSARLVLSPEHLSQLFLPIARHIFPAMKAEEAGFDGGNASHTSYGNVTPDKESAPPVDSIDGGIALDRDTQLHRGLKSRHIQFLALGGA